MTTKREETIDAIWRAIDPSQEGIARECYETVKATIAALPIGTFADEAALSGNAGAVEAAIKPFRNSLEAFKLLSDDTVITNSDLRRSSTMPNHYLKVSDLRTLLEAISAPLPATQGDGE